MLKAMPSAQRDLVVERLSPQERVQLEALLTPQRNPDECLSPWLAEMMERLRDGAVPRVTEKARAAYLSAAQQLGNSGTAQRLEALADKPSLVGRLGGWLRKTVA